MNTHDPRDPKQQIDREDFAQIGGWMKELDQDEPSLAWRADLNAKLEQLAPKPKRRRMAWPVWGTAVGMAAICAVVFLTPKSSVKAPTASLANQTESAILDAHRETVARHDLGLPMASDLKADQGAADVGYEWDVVDLSAL